MAENWGSVVTALPALCEDKHYSMGAIDIEKEGLVSLLTEPLSPQYLEGCVVRVRSKLKIWGQGGI